MKYFFDTEFIEDGKTIDLISIGIVAEDGRNLYLQNLDCNFGNANDWVRQNVIEYLEYKSIPSAMAVFPDKTYHKEVSCWRRKEELRDEVLAFISSDKPEFWAYFADYDWVALCQLFGTMMDLPKGWPKYCNDIKQLAMQLGNPDLHKACDNEEGEHHALVDARWNKRAYDYLRSLQS